LYGVEVTLSAPPFGADSSAARRASWLIATNCCTPLEPNAV
jgi:hypothetical protein